MIDFPQVHAKIADVLEKLKTAHYTYEEAKELMFSEHDALDGQDEVLEGSEMWDEIRELQHKVVNEYSSDVRLYE